jgi:transposase
LPASRLGANNYRSILDLSPGETRVQIEYKM